MQTSYKKRKKGFGTKKPSKTATVNENNNIYNKNNDNVKSKGTKQIPVSLASLASENNISGPPPSAPQPQNGGIVHVAEKKRGGFMSRFFGRK